MLIKTQNDFSSMLDENNQKLKSLITKYPTYFLFKDNITYNHYYIIFLNKSLQRIHTIRIDPINATDYNFIRYLFETSYSNDNFTTSDLFEEEYYTNFHDITPNNLITCQ